MPIALDSLIPLISLFLSFLTFYQRWNDRVAALVANDARQEAMLRQLEKNTDFLKDIIKHKL